MFNFTYFLPSLCKKIVNINDKGYYYIVLYKEPADVTSGAGKATPEATSPLTATGT